MLFKDDRTMDAIPAELLGRYEYTLGQSNKHWTCEAQADGSYRSSWGPIGAPPMSSRTQALDLKKALSKIREKLREGYEHTQNHRAAVVAVERLALEALFEQGGTTLKRRTRRPADPGAAPVPVETPPPAAPRPGRRRL